MSLTHRAKKRFLATLSKKKKFKVSDQKDYSPQEPPSPPMTSFEEPVGYLHFSKSLPDQLDISEAIETPKLSFRYFTYIETTTSNPEISRSAGDTTLKSILYESLGAKQKKSSNPSESSCIKAMNLENCNIDSGGVQFEGSNVTFIADGQRKSRHENEIYLRKFDVKKNSPLQMLNSESRIDRDHDLGSSSECLKLGKDVHTCSLQKNSSLKRDSQCDSENPRNGLQQNFTDARGYKDRGNKVQPDLSLSGEDTEMSDEVFSPDILESDYLSNGSQVSSIFKRSMNIATDNIRPDTQIYSRNTTNKNTNIPELKKDNPKTVNNNTSSPTEDSSVHKKIKFFEDYSYIKRRPSNANSGSNLLTKIYRSKQSSSTCDVDKKLPSSKHSRSISMLSSTDSFLEEVTGKSSRKYVKQVTAASSFRGFTSSSSAQRQRINFSRFRRSDSIPEVVALCGCGELCEGTCKICGCGEHCEGTCKTCGRWEFCEETCKIMTETTTNETDSQETEIFKERGNEELTTCQVCHHEKCTQNNDDMPLMLCRACDRSIHKNPEFSGHLVLDFKQKPPAAKEKDVSEDEPTNLGQRSSEDTSETDTKEDTRRNEDHKRNTPNGRTTSFIFKKFPGDNGHFTLKFGKPFTNEDELVVVTVIADKTLQEAIEPILQERHINLNHVDVYIENSETPLPMTSPIVFLVNNNLQVKEREDRDTVLRRSVSRQDSGSGRGIKQRGPRRESMGIASLLLEAPPVKQRRGSLQLPFRDHFFTRTDSKTDVKSDGPTKVLEDNSSKEERSSRGPSNDNPALKTSGSFHGWMEQSLRSKKTLERERQDQLGDILHQFSINGLPPFPELLTFGRQKLDENLLEMETSWKLIVKDCDNLREKQRKHQEAVWELLHTEVSYIRHLRVITDVFQSCLMNIQQRSLLNEIDTERLLSNINEVLECNYTFWTQHLLPIVQRSRDTGQLLDPMMAKEAFVDHFPNLFQVYVKYFIAHKSSLEYVKTCSETNELFKIFIQWVQNQKQFKRLRLLDFLVQPMPRLLKYSLLLQRILENMDNERDQSDIKAMIHSVERFCDYINETLKSREEYEKLETIRKTIDPYEPLDAPTDECAKIVQTFARHFNLLSPMPGARDGPRTLLFKSTLRMKEAQNAKTVDCLLFTDLLLICKPNRKMERFKIIRPPMRLDQLVVNELRDKGSFLLIYLNEYSVPISAFSFHSDAGVINGWLERFREAQAEFKALAVQMNPKIECLRSETAWSQLGDMNVSFSSISSDLEASSSSVIIPRTESADSLDHFVPNLSPSDKTPSEATQAKPVLFPTGADVPKSVTLSAPNDVPTTSFNFQPKQLTFNNTLLKEQAASMDVDLKAQSSISNHSPGQTQDSLSYILEGKTYSDANMNAHSLPAFMPNDSHKEETIDEKCQYFDQSLPDLLKKNSDLSETLKTISKHENKSIDGESIKRKGNSRRTDKRYRTADEISDIKNIPKDASIHKWSSLRIDAKVSDPKTLVDSSILADSLQSFPSSSGVSSNGSLHLTTETYEEQDTANGNIFIRGYPPTSEYWNHVSVDNADDLENEKDFVDNSNRQSQLFESKHSKSKSTSDLVEVFTSLQVSTMTDGIASVAMPTDGLHRRLTQHDIMKMKKIKHQILSDASIESSDV